MSKHPARTETVAEEEALVAREFSAPERHPFEAVTWETRNASITDAQGRVIFKQEDVEVPKFWSQTATNIAVSKYFRGRLGTPQREQSARQMVGRVSSTIAGWGRKDGYFSTDAEAALFEAELAHLLVNQYAAFNSPVWFNVGVEAHPQSSACFINSVKDDMRSILQLAVTEGMLFKYGSGTGTNLSVLRSSKEHLSFSSGKASGPVSFMKGFDTFAGVIRSGGKTRRAAKMVILNADHPDIADFINCKANEEKKAWALIEAGYNPAVDGDAYGSVFFQNANNSVRVTDEFMQAVIEDRNWTTKAVTTGQPVDTFKARDLMRMIAEATYICGDPGMQFDTTTNRWHTCKNSGRINASNPCSEYVFLDDTACNLASFNLMKFRRADGSIDTQAFQRATEVMIAAMEIIVGNSAYPTEIITKNSNEFRTLGLGYANLGALLMSNGLAYDGDEGRNYAAAITALLTGHAYKQSAKLAARKAPFPAYAQNEEPMLAVIGMHRNAAYAIDGKGVPADLLEAARKSWDEALELGRKHGFKNAQISVLAPTGTIGFLMDCDTTGVEPDIALVKYKWLVGGGVIKIVNQTVPLALEKLGYSEGERTSILKFLEDNDTVEGAPALKDEHLPVFDCAFKAVKGKRSIAPMGHVRMMAAVQPFISGAISKTVNVPEEATTEEIMNVYIEAWKLGLKAIAIYRDGSKRTQPLTTRKTETKAQVQEQVVYKPIRRRLPDERHSLTHKFSINSYEGYITAGLFEDGTPGEVFITMSKEGSTISGLMDAFATSISMALQYGVPLRVLCAKFLNSRFEPSGYTQNPDIRTASSITDYLFRWLSLKFLSDAELTELQLQRPAGKSQETAAKQASRAPETRFPEVVEDAKMQPKEPAGTGYAAPVVGAQGSEKVGFAGSQMDAPLCRSCGSLMVRSGSCHKCFNCGETSGCS